MSLQIVADGIAAKRCGTAIKGWSVSTKEPLRKGAVVGRAAPLLVRQTLANREQALVCGTCHRFVGTPATQLAMLEGLSCPTTSTATVHVATHATINSKKRRRCGEARTGAGGSPQAVTSSRRIAVALAPPSLLPALPPVHGEEDETSGTGAEEEEEEKEGMGGVWRCEGGLPCGDVYCSIGCREAALVGGHRLTCLGGSEPGSPLFEFHRYAARTNETYLIAAAAVAAALSTPRNGSADGDDGTRPFESLQGWDEPYVLVSQAKSGAGGDGAENGLGGCDAPGGGDGNGEGDGASDAVKGIGVPIEEAEEAWSLLISGLLYGLDGSGSEGRENRGRRALSLDFFLRMVRALGRHLSPITVPSPLVSYCASLVQASPETKARALPWLAPAVKRAGPVGGADGGEDGGVGDEGFTTQRRRTVAVGGKGNEAQGERRGEAAHAKDSDEVMQGERGLCRLVQASGAATACTATSPFPPLSVVGLLPPHCTPQHSCVPNVQLEAYLLPNTTVQDGSAVVKGTEGSLSALRVGLVTLRDVCAGGELFGPYVALAQCVQDRQRELLSTFYADCAAESAEARPALPPVAASSAAASSSGQQRRRQPQPQLVCSCPRCLFEAEGDSRSCSREMLKILADQALEEGRHEAALRLYSASLAPDESSVACSGTPGRRDNGGTRPGEKDDDDRKSTRPTSLAAAAAVATAAGVEGRREEAFQAGVVATACADPKVEAVAAAAAAAAAAGPAAVAVTGDALHGVGVALLALGKFRAACRAWERGFLKAPHHPALLAQAEKEAAYRPRQEKGDLSDEGMDLKEEGREGPPSSLLLPQVGNEGRPTAACPARGNTAGLLGVVEAGERGRRGGDGTHDIFASISGRAGDIFLSRAPVLSPEECREVIRAAEEYSRAHGGWTTSRHYAVPTTDLPIHVLEPVLPWFRSLVRERLFPALAENFGLAGGAQRVFVHDAFVVRYEEGKQRHLPLHRDQSTHSFTLALNSLDQYTGGGTFFPCLGRSIRPPEGHALSFRGDILHGGDPILTGVRYIIACFCYHDDDDGDADRESGGGERGGPGRGDVEQTGLDGGAGRGSGDRNNARRSAAGARSSGGCEHNGNGSVSSRIGTERGEGHAAENRKGGGGGGIEFRSDSKFSFGFGFG